MAVAPSIFFRVTLGVTIGGVSLPFGATRCRRIRPPTIAGLQAQGVAGARVTCCDSRRLRSTPIPFEQIGLAPEALFPAIVRLRQFTCSNRGSKRVDVSPDWREYLSVASAVVAVNRSDQVDNLATRSDLRRRIADPSRSRIRAAAWL